MDHPTRGTLTAEDLAATAGSSTETIHRLATAGILRPTADGRFVEGDRHRLRLVAAFEASGVPLEALVAGVAAGRIRFAAYDELHAELGPTSERTYATFRAAVDPDGDRLAGLFTALGLAEPSDATHLPVRDEQFLEAYVGLSEETGDPVLATRVIRLYGEASRRTAAGTLQAYGEAVRELAPEFAAVAQEDYFALVARWTRFAQGLPALAGWLAARHMSNAIDAFSVELVEQVLALGGHLAPRKTAPPGIAFVDLTGFTRTTQRIGDEAAAGLSMRLGDVAREVAERHGGRLVKLLGDGALLHAPDGPAAAALTLDILDALVPAGLPSGHAGLHVGPIVEGEGDVFGRTVNLAARLSDAAPDGATYVLADLAGAFLGERLTTEIAGTVHLQGIGDVKVARLRRA